jgi:hypothetical protein
MSGLEVALWALAIASCSLVWIAGVAALVNRTPSLGPDERPGPIHPISGARDQVVIYRTYDPYLDPLPEVFVPMPESLRTRARWWRGSQRICPGSQRMPSACGGSRVSAGPVACPDQVEWAGLADNAAMPLSAPVCRAGPVQLA